MADQSQSACFRDRFESVLQTYQQTTGITLAEHPLAVELQSCHSVDSITAILKREARAPNGLLESDRVMKSIERIISMLSTFFATASFGDAIGLVRRGNDALIALSLYIFDGFYSHVHLQRRYLLASLSYSPYVPLSSTFMVSL
jgi:hypothetical protein